ncbi:DUF1707 domain-containing protein [Kribbella sp. NPDC051770]|uniref:DUF1707 SHOCT-like domain-containing protein n=1 Tax=Kribbella sp. NPDC051770 TaxID=3155413 RepID=UPI0034487FD1
MSSPERLGAGWGKAERSGALRIGDAERDQAVAALGDHFVAGRLTQDEFEERSERATKARYDEELAPLFADLPDQAVVPVQPAWAAARGRQPSWVAQGRPPAFLFVLPFLMVGLVIASVSFAAPWVLWVFFWIALFGGPMHHRRHRHTQRR